MAKPLTTGEKIARDLCEMDAPTGDVIEVCPIDVTRRIDEEVFSVLKQLTAEQSKVKVLTDAVQAIEINAEECLDFDECTAMLIPIDDYHALIESLATVKGE